MDFFEIIEMLRGVTPAGVAVRFALALICGGIIGLERESKRRSAGFRTHTLVCIGATLTTLVGLYLYKSGLSTDPTRLGAQVISGMGFLGAGYFEAALIGVAIVMIAALILSKFEYFIMSSAKRMNIYIEFDSPGMLDRLVERLEGKGIRVIDIEFTKQRTVSGERCSAVLTLIFKKRQKHENILSEMTQFDGVYSVEEL